jgi:hypothetical protein
MKRKEKKINASSKHPESHHPCSSLHAAKNDLPLLQLLIDSCNNKFHRKGLNPKLFTRISLRVTRCSLVAELFLSPTNSHVPSPGLPSVYLHISYCDENITHKTHGFKIQLLCFNIKNHKPQYQIMQKKKKLCLIKQGPNDGASNSLCLLVPM